MPSCVIDHLVVTAPTLDSGAAFVRCALGVEMQVGGEHPRMGTHNLLLRLGDSVFLEVLSPNPDAPPPSRARWFGLDALRPDAPPALRARVARTNNIQTAVAAAPEPLGSIEPMSRGTLDWHITIPGDGVMPFDGIAPAVIDWHAPSHPAAGLQDRGLSLVGLELFHPEAQRLSDLLLALGLEGSCSVAEPDQGDGPSLVARIDTPGGRRVLRIGSPEPGPGS